MFATIAGALGISSKALAIGTVVALSLSIFVAVFGFGVSWANLKGDVYDSNNAAIAADAKRCVHDDTCRGVRDPNAVDH